jgi:hypothetical protein
MKVYAKRAARWRSNSWPYITGDAFADIADVVLNPPRFRGPKPTLKEIRRARIIFVKSSDLLQFLEDFKTTLEARVVIASNSDAEFHESFSIPKSVRKIFLQNSFISDNDRITTLPIGIENFRWGVNGDPRNINYNSQLVSESKILFGPFGNTHPVREQVKSEFNTESEFWKFIDGYIPPSEFNSLSHQFNWIACVRGNGIDTHRLWETFYRGRFPIIADDEWSRSLDYLNLPIRKISRWNKSNLINVMGESSEKFNPSSIPQLWMPYWIKRISETLS